VRFVPFSELVEWAETFSPDTFVVPSFEDDPGFKERVAAAEKDQNTATAIHTPRNMNESQLRIHRPQKPARPHYENLTLDFEPAMPNQHELHAQVKMTNTTRQGEIRYEGRVAAERKPAA
jgi:hypothetical protein